MTHHIHVGIGVAIIGACALVAAEVTMEYKRVAILHDPDRIVSWNAQDLATGTTMTSSMIAGIGTHSYTFAPSDDITASELAEAFKILLPALACRNVMGNGCDVVPAIEASEPNVRRHFRKD